MVTDCPSDQAPRESSASRPRRDPAERDLGLRIASDGEWLYRGSPIRRIELVKLFATVLRREADGSYWLITPVERGRITVDDAPFVAVELGRSGEGRAQRLRLRTNLDAWVTIGPEHPLRLRRPAGVAGDSGPAPYVELRGGLEARVARPVWYELVELAEERAVAGRRRIGIWSEGHFFALDEQGA
ncbi:MAG TPA: DUF1285 domain-containing protein [Geminicoccaceae bacterium]|nr:DUF1285 domain-containing protein [Geminicoccaceae bacterium]